MSAGLRAAAFLTLQSYGQDPRKALFRAFLTSFYCRTALIDNRPVAMWGVAGSLLGETAFVWLVIAQDIVKLPLSIVREARDELARIMENYGEIATTVLPDDEAAVRFAVFFGFQGGGYNDGKSRQQIQREISENPDLRIPVGDNYVVALSYHPEARN